MDKFTKKQLINTLKNNNVKFNSNLKKDELIKLIKKYKIGAGNDNIQPTKPKFLRNNNPQNKRNSYQIKEGINTYNKSNREALNQKMTSKSSMGNKTKSWGLGSRTLSRKTRDLTRLKDVEVLASYIPRDPVDEAGGHKYYFSKNLWRNLKRNMLILASVPSTKLEEILLTTKNGKNDFSALEKMVSRSGLFSSNSNHSRIKIEPEYFLKNSQNLSGGKKILKNKK